MLFESPFYVDYPVAIAAFTGAVAGIALWLLIVFNRRGFFHDLVVAYFHRCGRGVPLDKWPKVARVMFVFFALLFGTMAFYCLSVATGVVKNKERTISPEQLERARKLFERARPDLKHGAER